MEVECWYSGVCGDGWWDLVNVFGLFVFCIID